jgi:4,5-dihydroxyphthalate decarboxylase
LEGKKVGVRAYSQTTGVWIRGILQHEYGVGLESITWVTMEDAHVAEYRDPPHAVRDSSGRGLRELLRTGEIAAIMGERNVDPRGVRPVISDSEQAAAEWSQRTGVFPVNHVITVRAELLACHPWLAGELTRLFEEARAVAGATELPYGLPPNRKAMQMLCDFAAEQKLTTRAYQVDEVFQASAHLQ